MEILRIEPVLGNDIAVTRNREIVPKSYYNAIFQNNNKTYTATIRTSTNHVAACRNEDNAPVKLKEETEYKLIEKIRAFNKKLEE